MYAYLIGTLGLGIVFSVFYVVRKDLRRVMVYSGLLYLFYGFIMFLTLRLLTNDPARAITPGYWSPPSVLGLNGRSGGYGVEDALFSFFAAGIAACLYELIFRLRVSKTTNKKLKKGHALVFALLTGSIVFMLTSLNGIYFFIFLQLFGAAAIVWQRKDLLSHALFGGAVFASLYAGLFLIFKALFPHFLNDYYHLDLTSHISAIGIPLEELLYAFTLGLMWAPIYEYEYRVTDSKNKRRSSKPRRLSPAVGGARR